MFGERLLDVTHDLPSLRINDFLCVAVTASVDYPHLLHPSFEPCGPIGPLDDLFEPLARTLSEASCPKDSDRFELAVCGHSILASDRAAAGASLPQP